MLVDVVYLNIMESQTEGRFGRTLNICTVSTRLKKKFGNGYDIKNFITSLTSLDDKLPDILLMCAHSVRVKKDIIELLNPEAYYYCK